MDELKAIVALARMLGRLREVVEDLRRITDHLETDPLAWGDPTRQYRHYGWLESRGIGRCLLVHYAVDEQRRIVYLKSFHPLPRGILDVGQG
jgi:hypothetical protein